MNITTFRMFVFDIVILLIGMVVFSIVALSHNYSPFHGIGVCMAYLNLSIGLACMRIDIEEENLFMIEGDNIDLQHKKQ